MPLLKPKDGLIVRDPETLLPLPAEGKEFAELSTFWIRRLNCGDVQLIEKKGAK